MTDEPERLDPDSDRAKRIAENLADVSADVEHAIQQRRRQSERAERDAKPDVTAEQPSPPGHIAALVDTWPPLTPHQRSVIAAAFQVPEPGQDRA
ncbi:MAG: hypothetical protein QOJ50_1563 [Cryptosporangiaceae bacterium]|jgi:hypothetical protein|nr:hypothetical protein [Cryptosporangiaceae bacterium]